MKLSLILLTLLIFTPRALAQSSADQSSAPPMSLTLTVKILSEKYCRAQATPGLQNLQMRLRLHFTNAGHHRVLLYRGHNLFYQTRIQPSAPQTGAGPYQVLTVNSRYFDEEPERLDQLTPGPMFVSLAPGATFQTEVTVGVSIASESLKRGQNMVRAGEHTLILTISTWYKSRAEGERLRARWQRIGTLRLDPVQSAPLTFTAAPQTNAAPCQ